MYVHTYSVILVRALQESQTDEILFLKCKFSFFLFSFEGHLHISLLSEATDNIFGFGFGASGACDKHEVW